MKPKRSLASGEKIVGEFKDGKVWNVTEYDKDQNVTGTYADGVWVLK
tara:strand:- start:71 stop:211 length:141 start_codon:yes stop_codon:yes gene_type:complete